MNAQYQGCNTIGGLQSSDRLYYEEAQKLWASRAKVQEEGEISRRFNEVWDRLFHLEQMLITAYRHIEELKQDSGACDKAPNL